MVRQPPAAPSARRKAFGGLVTCGPMSSSHKCWGWFGERSLPTADEQRGRAGGHRGRIIRQQP
jgi:hypothetical protein